ncbi:MFS transporter [uncultured Limosilactobacillus sp.]|uniref:MFS transporter n=1 Tax=uncultured Limosilactobacillus sp. TaxID=2837629 RepID=UPI0025EABA0F|nr:MFS transporter [uncultured Limosilactobacillus sp.]
MPQRISRGHEWLIILALLSLNIVEQAASVVNATIPGMAKSFPAQSLVHIELVATVVSVFVTIFVLISGAVVRQIGQKQTAILGLLIATISSVVPAMANNFTVVLVSRAVFGIGIGLANPLAISMIGVFFTGERRARLMGWRSAVAGIGTAIMTYVAGKLLLFGWHQAYWVYLLFLPTLLLFVFFVPDPEKVGLVTLKPKDEGWQATTNQAMGKNPSGLIIMYAVLIFLLLVLTMVFAVKLPTFFVQSGIGSATQASTTWSIVNVTTVIGGFIFGPVYKKLGKYVLPLSLVLGGLCIFLIGISHSVLMVQVIAGISGIASSLAIPYIFERVSEVSSSQRAPFYTSIVLVGSNLGSFLSPYAGEILGTTAKATIIHAGICEIVLAIIILVAVLFMKKSPQTME